MKDRQISIEVTVVVKQQCLLALLLSLLAMQNAVGGTRAEVADGVRVFPTSWFAASQPRTALDLVERLPGFELDGGDNDVRGYSGSAGNVLIDGRRPVSKQGNLATALDRIPVATVARVELIRGSSSRVDMQGWPVVANVVRSAEASTSARALGAARVYEDGPVRPEARFEAMRTAPGSVVEGTLHLFDVKNDSGTGFRLRKAVAGEPLYDADRTLTSDKQGFAATAGLERLGSRGDLRINAVMTGNRAGSTEDLSEVYPGRSEIVFGNDESNLNAEIGLQASRNVGRSSQIGLLAIQQLRRFDVEETETGGPASKRFVEEGRSGETIMRAFLRTTMTGGQMVEWGGEAAYNFLRSDSAASVDGQGVELPASSADVREFRGELFGRLAWMPAAGMAAEIGLAGESSRIEQSGSGSSSKSLYYLKPRASVSWAPTLGDQLRLHLQRTVGQLDFGDFVSSAELSTGTVNVGNTDLEPSTAWELELSWERQFAADTTLIVSLLHAEISDVIDIAPIVFLDAETGEENVYEGLSNIGNGMQSAIGVDLSLSLERIGIVGGLLTANLAYSRSSVTDPVTGERRRISGAEYPWDGSIGFTQDLPTRRFRWGVNLPLGDSEPEYRVSEVRQEKKNVKVDLFAEYFPGPDWAVGVALQNLARRERSLERALYDAPRDSGQIEAVSYEYLQLESHVRFYAQRDFL